MQQDAKKKTADLKAERADQRRGQIFEAAARVFAAKGFHIATVQDVADEAGLGKGTLYEYVQSKKELLLLVLEEGQQLIIREVAESIAGLDDPIEKLRAIFHRVLELVEEHRNISRMIMPFLMGLEESDFKRLESTHENFISLCEGVVSEGVEAGVLRPVNGAVIAELLVHNCMLWTHSDLLARNSGGIEAYESLLNDIFFNGILRRDSAGEKE